MSIHSKTKLLKLVSLVTLVAVLLLAPYIVGQDPYYLHLFIMFGIYIVFTLSLWLILTTGQLTLGHAAFIAIGAFTSVVLVMRADLSFWIALPLAGVMSAIIAVIIGYPVLRIKGLYFALVTFSFSEVVRFVFSHWSFFGGKQGFYNIPRPGPFLGITIDFHSKVPYYYMILVIVFIAVLVMYRLYVSRFGRIFTSIAENDSLAESVGINIARYKVLAFTIGSFFAGLTGSFYAHYFIYVNPDMFNIWKSIELVIAVSIGGIVNPAGAVIGAVFLTYIHERLRGTEELGPILLAVTFLIIVFTMPKGLLGLPGQVRIWFSKISKMRRRYGIS